MSIDMTDYMRYIHKSRYARFNEEKGRRETWEETIQRYIHYFISKYSKEEIDYDIIHQVEKAILNLEVMPSMRAVMTAGPALDRDHVAGYNCSYLPVDSPRAFDEAMYILCCGTGVGFSVERQYINQLPVIAEEFHDTETVIVVADSKIGWAKSFRELISLLYAGQIPQWDLSKIRPAGARLKTFGGRASGPEPLDELFRFTITLFENAKGRRLNSLECHDLMCKMASAIVVGGVRRSALISLSNLTDERMRNAKSGQWWVENDQRTLANNSVCYTEKPDIGIFMKEWVSLYESKSGERGIYSRVASKRVAERNGRRDSDHEFGTNPCSEIILRPYQFCNLSEVIVRPDDTFEDLKRKVRIATICGTLQSTLTDFRYLRSIWKKNTDEERLLGVSLTGIMDHPLLSGSYKDEIWPQDWGVDVIYGGESAGEQTLKSVLKQLKEVAIETNKDWSEKLGIPQSTAITCVKPSGTVSQLVDSSSGIHPRYSDYYIRTVRTDKKDPLYQFLKDSGVPVEDAIKKEESTAVFSFPMKAPKDSVKRNDMSAIDQLELWKIYAEHWCEHKPSITVYMRDEEVLDVGAWVYKNFDICSGVSFLPHTDHIYKQAPYQEIDEDEYNRRIAEMPEIHWDRFHEVGDNTTGQQELACTAGQCDLI